MMLCQKLASGTAVKALPPQLAAVAEQPANTELVSICSKGFIPSAKKWINRSLEGQYNNGNFLPPVPTWDSEEACMAAPTNSNDPNYKVCQSVSANDSYSCSGCCLLYANNDTGTQTSPENNCCLPAKCSATTSAPVSCLVTKGQIAPGAETICKKIDTLYTAFLNNACVLQVLWNSYLQLGYNSPMQVIEEFKKIMNWKLSTWKGPNGATANDVNNYLGQMLATT